MNGASLPDEYEAEVINHGLSKHWSPILRVRCFRWIWIPGFKLLEHNFLGVASTLFLLLVFSDEVIVDAMTRFSKHATSQARQIRQHHRIRIWHILWFLGSWWFLQRLACRQWLSVLWEISPQTTPTTRPVAVCHSQLSQCSCHGYRWRVQPHPSGSHCAGRWTPTGLSFSLG